MIETPAASFSTLAVLTAYSGKPWTHNADLVRELLGFVLGDVLTDAQVPGAAAVAAPELRRQYPALAQCHLPRSRSVSSAAWSQLADDRRHRVVARLGEELVIRQMAAPDWTPFRGLSAFLAAARRSVPLLAIA